MSQIPNFPKNPELNQKHYNFKWDGHCWVNLSNKGIMLISADEIDLPIYYTASGDLMTVKNHESAPIGQAVVGDALSMVVKGETKGEFFWYNPITETLYRQARHIWPNYTGINKWV